MVGDDQDPGTQGLVEEQSEYYRQRAPEYEDWWLRRGRYDQGRDLNEHWFSDARQLEDALAEFAPSGRVLELACGTGLWTRHLVRYAEHVSAIDGSAEMIALNRERMGADNVDYLQADIFQWQPIEQYDVCFFSFWLSHVPREWFTEFWGKVAKALRPGGRVFFIDSASSDHHGTPTPGAVVEGLDTMRRTLADGREYVIVKRFYEPRSLEQTLEQLGFKANVCRTSRYFIYASAQPC